MNYKRPKAANWILPFCWNPSPWEWQMSITQLRSGWQARLDPSGLLMSKEESCKTHGSGMWPGAHMPGWENGSVQQLPQPGAPKSVGTYAPALPGAVHSCAWDMIPLHPDGMGQCANGQICWNSTEDADICSQVAINPPSHFCCSGNILLSWCTLLPALPLPQSELNPPVVERWFATPPKAQLRMHGF